MFCGIVVAIFELARYLNIIPESERATFNCLTVLTDSKSGTRRHRHHHFVSFLAMCDNFSLFSMDYAIPSSFLPVLSLSEFKPERHFRLISAMCNDKLSPCRLFVIEWWRYLQHGYRPGTGSHDHRPILPPSGKSCPVRGEFRLVWNTRRLDTVFYCYR